MERRRRKEKKKEKIAKRVAVGSNIDSVYIYIRTRFVIARRRQLGGQLCAPLQGPEYLIPSLVYLISPPVPLSPYLISSELDDFAGSLSGVRRLLLSRIHIWREGEGPEAVLSFPKAKTQPPVQSELRRPIQTARLINRLSPSVSYLYIRDPSFY